MGGGGTTVRRANGANGESRDSARVSRSAHDKPPLTVLMAGPHLDVMGGVSAVEKLLISSLPPHIRVTHVATMVDGGRTRKLWTFVRALRRWVAELRRRPTLVHIHFSVRASSIRKELLARIALACGARVIMHAHAGEYRAYWAHLSDAARTRSLSVFRRARALIVLGEGWRDFFTSIGVPANRIIVLPNPVRLPRRAAQRPSSDVVTCVYLGLIAQKKGAFDLVRAVALLPASCRTRLRVVMAGNGELERLRALVQELGTAATIEVRSWLSTAERDALLAEAQVFALPSYNEGLPMSLLEAMAFGVAPVTTPVGAIPEVLRHESNGLFVAPGDIAALASALRRMIEDSTARERFAHAARAAVEPLSVERYIERLQSLYQAVASEGSLECSAIEDDDVRRLA